MIDIIPARAVFRACVIEQRMIQEDLADDRDLPLDDTVSILSFCHFLEAARLGGHISACVLPAKHMLFYRKTVVRLINAGELNQNAKKQFDDVFSESLPQMLAA
jgi:hypothetical protein